MCEMQANQSCTEPESSGPRSGGAVLIHSAGPAGAVIHLKKQHWA
jgi:hypothetical protein